MDLVCEETKSHISQTKLVVVIDECFQTWVQFPPSPPRYDDLVSVFLDFLVDFFWPKFCVVCDKEGSFLCQKCKKNLPSALQVCPMCTRPNLYGSTHEICYTDEGLDGLLAVFDYKNNGVKKIVEGIKYGFNSELVEIVLKGWKYPKKRGDELVFVPVPLHRYRENWRGFNQAELLANKFAGKKAKVEKILKRIRATKQQASMESKKERQLNVKNSFVVDNNWEEKVEGKKIVLVDDVYTTGTTMKECAKVLKGRGAKEVWGLVLAR